MREVDEVRDVLRVVGRYLKQETVDPFRAIGAMVVWGLVGSVLAAGGFVLAGIGLLRLLQTETGTTFAGHLDWLPYVIVVVVLAVVVAIAAARIGRRAKA